MILALLLATQTVTPTPPVPLPATVRVAGGYFKGEQIAAPVKVISVRRVM